MELLEILSYGFIQRGLLGGLLISIACSFLGVFLVLKNYSLIGDGLAHVNFATIGIALLLGFSPLVFSIPTTIVASFIIQKLTSSKRLSGDTVIALVSTTSIGVGILASSIGDGFNVDLLSYLFGSILLISKTDLIISLVICIGLIFIMIFYYNEILAFTYDDEFSKVLGIDTKFLSNLLLVLTAVAISVGIRLVGTMLISSLLVFPSAIASNISRSFKEMVGYSLLVGGVSIISGILMSFILDLPSGACIVLVDASLFGLSYIFKRQ